MSVLDRRTEQLTSVVHVLAGSTSGLLSTVLFQPFDVLKTRRQSQSHAPLNQRIGFYDIVKHEGVRSLWRGTVPSIFRTVPGVGLYIYGVNNIKAHLLQSTLNDARTKTLPPMQSLEASLLARSVIGAVLMPFTVVKTRVESGLYTYNSTLGALHQIGVREGPLALFVGLQATLLRDAPYSAIYFLLYEQAKGRVREWSQRYDTPVATLNFLSALVSGLIATIVTHPPDVLRTKIQLHGSTKLTMTNAAKSIWNSQGWNGLWAGLAPRATRRALMAATTWTIYESVVDFYTTRMESRLL